MRTIFTHCDTGRALLPGIYSTIPVLRVARCVAESGFILCVYTLARLLVGAVLLCCACHKRATGHVLPVCVPPGWIQGFSLSVWWPTQWMAASSLDCTALPGTFKCTLGVQQSIVTVVSSDVLAILECDNASVCWGGHHWGKSKEAATPFFSGCLDGVHCARK